MMLNGIGADVNYYVAPDAEQQTFLAAHGRTWAVVPIPSGMTVDSSGQVSDARLFTQRQNDPYIMGGGNPLYADPSNIPPPPRPYTENCLPTDATCVQRNQDKTNAWNDLAVLYQRALNGAYDPTAPDRYIAALDRWNAGGGAPLTATSGGSSQPTATPGTVRQPSVSSGPQAAVVPVTPPASASGAPIGGAAGGPAGAQGGSPSGGTEVPSWVWIAGAAAVGFFVLKGKN